MKPRRRSLANVEYFRQNAMESLLKSVQNRKSNLSQFNSRLVRRRCTISEIKFDNKVLAQLYGKQLSSLFFRSSQTHQQSERIFALEINSSARMEHVWISCLIVRCSESFKSLVATLSLFFSAEPKAWTHENSDQKFQALRTILKRNKKKFSSSKPSSKFETIWLCSR